MQISLRQGFTIFRNALRLRRDGKHVPPVAVLTDRAGWEYILNTETGVIRRKHQKPFRSKKERVRARRRFVAECQRLERVEKQGAA
jgi:hypothetical protein